MKMQMLSLTFWELGVPKFWEAQVPFAVLLSFSCAQGVGQEPS